MSDWFVFCFPCHHLTPRHYWHFSPWSLHPRCAFPIWCEAGAAGGLGGLAGVCRGWVKLSDAWAMVRGCTELLFAPRVYWISVYRSVQLNLWVEQQFDFFDTPSLLPNLVENGQQMQNYGDSGKFWIGRWTAMHDHANLASLRNKARKFSWTVGCENTQSTT